MYRFINTSRTISLSKKYEDIVFRCFSCELNAIQTRFVKPLIQTSCNFLPRSKLKFCSIAEEEYVSEEDITNISGGDAELERKLRVIILEADVMNQDGKCVPSLKYMKHQHWQELLTLNTRTARSRFLTFLFKTQMKIENQNIKKEEQRILRESRPKMEFPDDGKMRYHIGGNNMFLRVYESTMNHMYNNKLIQAMQFGQKLIIDCGFHNNMNRIENTNCAKQLMLLFSENRYHDDPFDLHFCNLQKDNRLHEVLQKFIPTMYNPEFPLNLHEQSYLDVFPKDKLVYLTPHCREEITNFDHDSLYIVGAIVDKTNTEPLTLAKAKQEGIRMGKLPLDRYLCWGSGSSKSLTLNQIVSILLDIKQSGDWEYSLRHVPKRKLFQSDKIQSVREHTDRLSNDLPVSKQLIRAARQSNRHGIEDVDYRRTKPVHTSTWRPNRAFDDESKKQRFDVKSILKSDM